MLGGYLFCELVDGEFDEEVMVVHADVHVEGVKFLR